MQWAARNKSNSMSDEVVIDLSDAESVKNEAVGYRVGSSSVKKKRSWDMHLWPPLLRRCGIVDEHTIAPGLHPGEAAFPLGCGLWEYVMNADQLFTLQCLGTMVNNIVGYDLVKAGTRVLHPQVVRWRVCHGWCNDPRLYHPTCYATSYEDYPLYDT